jgi:hypothetical protein
MPNPLVLLAIATGAILVGLFLFWPVSGETHPKDDSCWQASHLDEHRRGD